MTNRKLHEHFRLAPLHQYNTAMVTTYVLISINRKSQIVDML